MLNGIIYLMHNQHKEHTILSATNDGIEPMVGNCHLEDNQMQTVGL